MDKGTPQEVITALIFSAACENNQVSLFGFCVVHLTIISKR